MRELETYHKFNQNVLSLFERLKITEQSPIHHKEGCVYKHVQLVISELEKIKDRFSEETYTRLLYTSLFHDIAKPETTEVVWEKRVRDVISPGHAKLGEKMFRELMWDEFVFEDREEIAKLIRYHGLPLFFEDKENPDMAIIKSSIGCKNIELSDFAEIDFKGRICEDLDSCLFKIELFRERATELGCIDKPYQFTSDWARLHYFKNGEYPGKEIWEPEGAWCTILSGVAGSGKNEWINKNYHGSIIELDQIRKKHKISPKDKNAQGFVAQEAKEMLRENLRKKQDVIWNATNLTVLQRASIIDLALQYKSKIRIVYIDCSLNKALKQNKQREEYKQIPEKAIEKMFKKMEIPDLTECHELVIVK